MSEVSFDTHAEIRKLEQSGIPLPQAEALLDMMSRAPASNQVAENLEYLRRKVDTNLATKADLATLKVSLAALREHVDTNVAAKTDLEELREYVDTHMATKDDLAMLRKHVDTGMASMATKDDLAVLRMEVRADLYRALWMQGGILGGLILALAGVMVAFSAFMASIA